MEVRINWIDISLPLSTETAGWPGDTPFSFSLSWSKQDTGSVNVGKVIMSTHMGTHIDAPYHFDENGKKTYDLDVNRYIGRAFVMDVSDKISITKEDVENVSLEGCKIILFKTMSWKNRTVFPEKITYVNKGVAEVLVGKGVNLIGVDVPSVDPLDSKELVAHHELAKLDIHILEGLVLDDINEGMYELIALPLPIVGGDGSPVRAVIRSI